MIKSAHKAYNNLFVITFLLICIFIPSISVADVSIGVLAPRGVLKTMSRWEDYAKYLESKIGEKIIVIPMPPSRILSSAKEGLFDFILTHPAHTIALVENQGATPLLTLNTIVGSEFAGVILVKKGSGIVSTNDLRGKKIMSLKFNSAAGAYIFQAYHLKLKGIDVHKDFKSIRQGKKQDSLILALNEGRVDAVFVRSGMLETMHKEGRVDKNNFAAIDAHDHDDIPHIHSTAHYPEWYLSAMPKADSEIVHKLKKLSLNLDSKNKALVSAKIKGFVEPLPIDGMRAALKSLKIAPYNK